MIHEVTGTLRETLHALASATLDPRDETAHCGFELTDEGRVWTFQGGFLDRAYAFHLRYVETEPVALRAAVRSHRATARYRQAWRGFAPHLDDWLRLGLANMWIRRARDPPFTERSFTLCRTAEVMQRAVDRDDWALGSAFVLAGADVCMIQQAGPGEFLMIRGTEAFDSWTTGAPYIHGARLVQYLEAVARAPLDDRGRPRWTDLVYPGGGPRHRELRSPTAPPACRGCSADVPPDHPHRTRGPVSLPQAIPVHPTRDFSHATQG